MSDNVFSISELNNYIKKLLDSDCTLSGLYVKGELSNYKMYPSGHHYFSMKDAEGALKCVMFKGSASKLRFRPENGMSVVAFGSVSVYPRDGAYQLYVNSLTPDGVGALYVAFEQLKEKLLKEGLFDEIHKKALPRFPKTIAVITSSAGAAVQDIIRILNTRWPMTKIVIMPVRVQGDEAPPEIVEAIKNANEHSVADIIITGRGGGSIEDLWAFNDERVARAIFASEIPVISAVGHEPDVTIADFVADVRAATPSNAAELAVPNQLDVFDWIHTMDLRMMQTINRDIKIRRKRIDDISGRHVMQSPGNYINDRRVHIDRESERLVGSMERRIYMAREKIDRGAQKSIASIQRKMLIARERFAGSSATLDAISPLKVLGRGYAIARRTDGTVIKNASDVSKGDRLIVRLQKDEIECVRD